MAGYDTKQMIFYAAIDLFAARGYSNVSMRDLAHHIGIRPASIYNHFSSKDEIMERIMEQGNRITSKTLAYIPSEEIGEQIKGKSFDEIVEETFAPFAQDQVQYVQKIYRILLAEQFVNQKAMAYWSRLAIRESADRWKDILDILVADQRLPPMNTLLAAELLTRVAISYIIEFAHYRISEDTEQNISMYTVYSYLFKQIKNGLI